MPLLTMENECLASLKQTLSELQAQDVSTQQKLDTLITHITSLKSEKPITTPNPCPHLPHPVPLLMAPLPALPSEFDRDCSSRMAFLYSCQTYICLCLDSFSDDQTKIVWVLSYMKVGWVEKWAAQVFCWEEENLQSYWFFDWEDFYQGFREEFCPAHTGFAAITHLKSTSYFQNKCSIDGYLNEFLNLISKAGYTDNKTIVVKFCRGLGPHIQDAIATMTFRHPSNEVSFQWYNAAWTLDQNWATNKAFWSSYCVPTSHQIPTQTRPPVLDVTWLWSPFQHLHMHSWQVARFFRGQVSNTGCCDGRGWCYSGGGWTKGAGFCHPQQVNCLPSLPPHNCFDVWSIESNRTIKTINKVMQDPEPSPSPTLTSLFHPKTHLKWKRKLLSKFIIAATEGNVKQKRQPDWELNPGPSRHIPDALTTELAGLTR